MVQDSQSNSMIWTATELAERFGPIPLDRVRHDPPAGSATERDVVEIHERENRLYELVDGLLTEKTVGTYEAYLALLLGRLLGNFVEDSNLGIVLGADGILRLAPGLVRIPDVSFVSWERLPNRLIPRTAIADLIPDLAVEIVSAGNTPQELEQKLRDYFTAGVRKVWYIYPITRQVHVYTAPQQHAVLTEQQSLEGGDVLPGFSLPLARLFAEPGLGR